MTDTPFVSGSDTSKAAADAIVPSAATLRAKVLRFIEWKGLDGATDEEIQAGMGMLGNTERPRRQELEARSLVGESGRRRPTRSKRQAVVWVAAAHMPAPAETKSEKPQKPQTVQAEIPSFLDLFGKPKEELR